MGAVYKAEQPEMNRFVAVKILHPKYVSRPDLVSRFRREARAMSHLSHPNTARVYMYGQLDDGACYIVMEHLEGKNLAQITRAEGMLKPARAVNIMVQVCGALEEAHRQGMVHRDLKPENIFLTSQGGIADFPKVLDFGLAKVTQREMRPGSLILTQEGMVFGTPEFMSPEQARGQQLDARSDIYSLGCILYEMLTGKLPFDAAQPMDYLALQIRGTPIPLGERVPNLRLPAGLDAVVMKTIEKEPDRRHATAADFALALKECLQEEVRDDAMRSVPKPDEASRARAASANALANESRRLRSDPPRSVPPVSQHSTRPQSTPAVEGGLGSSLPQSPMVWAAIGAGAMLVLGGIIVAAVMLLR
ncbi:MAG: Serine/threonine protein kinase PrkC, regulator of stationary phase [Myxococcaceae bacterium]|nr:Serine/threonine protein kinase PrkC, regulator of stationary phase [Myxococcaceae bacterium]